MAQSRAKVSVVNTVGFGRVEHAPAIQITLSKTGARKLIEGDEKLIMRMCKDVEQAIEFIASSTN